MRRSALFALLLAAAAASGCSALGDDGDLSNSAVSGSTLQDQVNTATQALTKAQKAVEADKTRARSETERLAPALKDAQLAAYATAFEAQTSVHANAAAFTSAAIALDAVVAGDPSKKAELEALAAANADVAKSLYTAYVDLAATPLSKNALIFAVGVLANPDAPLSKRVLAAGNAKAIETNILARALTTVAIVDVGATNDVLATMEHLRKLLEPLKGSSATSDIYAKIDVIEAALKTQNVDAMKTYATSKDRPAIQALAATGISLQLLDAKDDTRALEFTRSLSSIAATGLSVVAEAVQAFADGAFLAHHGFQAANATLELTSSELTLLASRLVPALGLLSSGLALVLDVQNAANLGGTAEVAAVLAIVGDVLTIAGCVVQLTIVGAPAGWVLRSVATAVTFVARLLADWAANQQLVAEESTCLLAAGMDPALAATLVKAPPAQLSALGHDLSFTAEAVQWMAVTSPNMVLVDDGHGNSLAGLAAMATTAKLTSDQRLAFLHAAVANLGDADRPDALPELMAILRGALLGAPLRTTSDWSSYLTNLASGGEIRDPAMKQELGDAATWLTTQAAP